MRTIFILEKKQNWDEPQQRARRRTPGSSEGQHGCARGLGTTPLGHSTDPEPSDPHPAWQDGEKAQGLLAGRPPSCQGGPGQGWGGGGGHCLSAMWLGGWEVTRYNHTAGWVPKEKDTPGSPSRPLKHLPHPPAQPSRNKARCHLAWATPTVSTRSSRLSPASGATPPPVPCTLGPCPCCTFNPTAPLCWVGRSPPPMSAPLCWVGRGLSPVSALPPTFAFPWPTHVKGIFSSGPITDWSCTPVGVHSASPSRKGATPYPQIRAQQTPETCFMHMEYKHPPWLDGAALPSSVRSRSHMPATSSPWLVSDNRT